MSVTERKEQNLFETGIVTSLVTKDDVVLDIGANVGYFTILLAGIAYHVLGFEPSLNNYRKLEENTIHLDNITLFNKAVSDTSKSNQDLYLCPLDNGMNRLYKSKWCEGGEIEKVETIAIDDLIFSTPRNYILFAYKVNFIKIDVEGFEYRVLMGMRKLLERDHPTIMLECHPPSIEEAGDSPRVLYELLKNEMGYQDPINCFTNGTITSYDKLEENTRHTPAVNLLWKYNS